MSQGKEPEKTVPTPPGEAPVYQGMADYTEVYREADTLDGESIRSDEQSDEDAKPPIT